jgi:hypothetical protein
MTKRISLIGVGMALVALLVAGLASGADGTTKHHFVLSDQGALVKSSNGYPAPGETALEAAALKLKLDGNKRKGADTRRIELISITGNTVEAKGKGVAYVANGSVKFKFHATITIGQGGSTTLDLTGRVTGGTRTYRGATGKFTGTGSASGPAIEGAILKTRAEGTISY